MNGYPDDAGGAPEAEMGMEHDEGETHDEQTEEQGAGESALIPKSLLAGKEFKPGDELVLKVLAMHGDEVEVEYATGKDEGDKSEKPMSKARMGIMDRMSKMADVE